MDEPIPDTSELDQNNALALAIIQPGNLFLAYEPFALITVWSENQEEKSGNCWTAEVHALIINLCYRYRT